MFEVCLPDFSKFLFPECGFRDSLWRFIFSNRSRNLTGRLGHFRFRCMVDHESQNIVHSRFVQIKVIAEMVMLLLHHYAPRTRRQQRGMKSEMTLPAGFTPYRMVS